MTLQKQTFLKVLLAPAWDHNFPFGPAPWLDDAISQPTGSQAAYAAKTGSSGSEFTGNSRTGRVFVNGDKYYREYAVSGNYANSDVYEHWWPKIENGGWGNATRFAWDCDPRTFTSSGHIQASTTATNVGGFGGSTNSLTYTKNRMRLTGIPGPSYRGGNLTTLDLRSHSGSNFSYDGSTSNAITAAALTTYPNHYQDAVHDAIIQGSFDTTTTIEKLLYPNKPGDRASASSSNGAHASITYGASQPTEGHQKGTKWAGATNTSASNVYTYGYEFTLNVESLTHSWETITAVTTLPGYSAEKAEDHRTELAQLNNLAIDMGSMKESIQVKGVIDDSPTGPAQQPTGEKWIRRQQLMDMARSQWAATIPESDNSEDGTYTNPNRFVALTIGPMYTENSYGDQGSCLRHYPSSKSRGSSGSKNDYVGNTAGNYVDCKAIDMWRYGDEPHDDMRGSSYQISSAAFPHVREVWDYQPNYKGRRRYRGLIKNLTFNLRGGRPDIWEFNFTLDVVKNEAVFRRSSDAWASTHPDQQSDKGA